MKDGESMKGSLREQKTKRGSARRRTGKLPCLGVVGADGNIILFNSVKCLNGVITWMIPGTQQWNSSLNLFVCELFLRCVWWRILMPSTCPVSFWLLAFCSSFFFFCRMTFEKGFISHFSKLIFEFSCQTLLSVSWNAEEITLRLRWRQTQAAVSWDLLHRPEVCVSIGFFQLSLESLSLEFCL